MLATSAGKIKSFISSNRQDQLASEYVYIVFWSELLFVVIIYLQWGLKSATWANALRTVHKTCHDVAFRSILHFLNQSYPGRNKQILRIKALACILKNWSLSGLVSMPFGRTKNFIPTFESFFLVNLSLIYIYSEGRSTGQAKTFCWHELVWMINHSKF